MSPSPVATIHSRDGSDEGGPWAKPTGVHGRNTLSKTNGGPLAKHTFETNGGPWAKHTLKTNGGPWANPIVETNDATTGHLASASRSAPRHRRNKRKIIPENDVTFGAIIVGPRSAWSEIKKQDGIIETDTAGHNPDLENAAIQGDGASAPQLRGFRDCVQGYAI